MLQLSIAFSGDKTLDEYIRLARLVEGYGFDTLSIYDDLMFKPAWPILFTIAQHTHRVRLGPAIVNPYLVHPAITAGNLALLDELTGGRAYLGIGRGAFLEPFGVEQPRPVTAVREAIEMVQRLLQGERTPYDGAFFQATASAALHWTPLRADVPVVVGTWGPKMCEMAGEVADEVKVSPMWSADYARILWGHIQAGARRAGRDPKAVRLCIGVLTSVSRDRAAARERARRSLAVYLPYLSPMTEAVGVAPEEIRRIQAASAQGDFAAAAQHVSDTSLDNFALCGTPADLVEQIRRMVDAAPVQRIEFGTPHGPDEAEAVRLLGEEVLPHFQ